MSESWRYSLRGLPPPVRWLLGLVPAAISVGLTGMLPATYRAPYLIAFLFVVLSAWYVGLDAAVVCALASGVGVEYFFLRSGVIPNMMEARLSPLRLLFFIATSLLVAWLLRQVSTLRQLAQNQDLKRHLDRVVGDSRLAEERSSAALAVREREARLQIALEGGHVGLWDNDLENGHVLWSDEHYRILGFEPGSVPTGYETMRNSTHPEDREPMDALFRETMAAARPFCCEYRVVWPDGSVRWVEAQAKYETNEYGEAIRMLGVMTDITHRKQAEAALLRTEKLAAAGRLAASIAHEINNPLEAVANLVYLISQAENLDSAREQADHAMTELMRVSRITQQTLKFHRQSESARRVRLSEVINDVLDLFRGRLAMLNITVNCRYENDPELECLAGDLRQVFANLIVNSLDAMSDGGILSLRLRRSRDWRNRERRGMRVTVADNGCGMDKHTRRRIYEPFFTTKKETGTGLGLWVTSEIIDRQHGDLRVWSSQTPGRNGTAFSLFLPLRDDSLGEISSTAHEKTLQTT
jgi:PAS domain S-box-containing protein